MEAPVSVAVARQLMPLLGDGRDELWVLRAQLSDQEKRSTRTESFQHGQVIERERCRAVVESQRDAPRLFGRLPMAFGPAPNDHRGRQDRLGERALALRRLLARSSGWTTPNALFASAMAPMSSRLSGCSTTQCREQALVQQARAPIPVGAI